MVQNLLTLRMRGVNCLHVEADGNHDQTLHPRSFHRSETVFAEVQRPRAIWAQMRFVARWAESNKWHDVATCPVLVDKLKALADEIERQQTAATEKAK